MSEKPGLNLTPKEIAALEEIEKRKKARRTPAQSEQDAARAILGMPGRHEITDFERQEATDKAIKENTLPDGSIHD